MNRPRWMSLGAARFPLQTDSSKSATAGFPLLRFGAALFVSASLLFSIQPVVGKAITPLLGGASAVWITCMLFFQALLLAGYVYAHVVLRWLGARRQALLQLAVVLVPLFFLPIHVDANAVRGWSGGGDPALRLLLLLTVTAGPPFFVLSTSAPLLQGWFASLKTGRDPYVLYAASNAGSVAALTAYPLLVEPLVGLSHQMSYWSYGYCVFILAVAFCAVALFRSAPPDSMPLAAAATDEAVSWKQRLSWFVLAFIPATYLMGVTTHITTDVTPIPLFWVFPLLLYLVTFILVFAKKQWVGLQAMDRPLLFGLTLAAIATLLTASAPMALIHLAAFFIATYVCHGRLAANRPGETHLTDFYLWISIGGVAGGFFNALIAPAIFSHITEYPLALVLAALARPTPKREDEGTRARVLDIAIPLALCAAAVAVFVLLGKDRTSIVFRLALGLLALVNYAGRERPRRFALGLGAILLASAFHTGALGRSLMTERNFFGVLDVTVDPTERFHRIIHGHIVHGLQFIEPARQREPLAYYHRKGPLGDVFDVFGERLKGKSVAVVGLGAGAVAAYAQPDQAWTFYEINPAVVRVAEDRRYFTFLSDAFPDKRNLHIEVGDARLRMEDAADGGYSLIILDAFSSDAIPVHLLTQEAVALYAKKLTPDGLLAFHISNQYLKLNKQMPSLARANGLAIVERVDVTDMDEAEGRSAAAEEYMSSEWVVMSKDPAALDALLARETPRKREWKRLEAKPETAPWSDDYSNILGVFRFSYDLGLH
ncbi:fused MFS/spermidine synthase [Pendulispora rubella]|uniref:Fused MFS/spermidine synthase n=1 Tax=Pendulispora rubella TaxID=2741070 RepID=A0ABZ2L027_9BACT